MAQILAGDVRLEYERSGPPGAECVLLIMGLGGQLVRWPEVLIQELLLRGFQVIRYDNRDAGLSQSFGPEGPPASGASSIRQAAAEAVYSLDALAQDAVNLMDALAIDRAHVAGVSMGGMIAQTVALNHPARTLSLTSIMSTTGGRDLPRSAPAAAAIISRPAPDPTDIDAIVENGVLAAQATGSPAYPIGVAELRSRLRSETLRAYRPFGQARQLAALMTAGDRRAQLARISVPTVVVHGDSDAVFPLEHGVDTAAVIPGATLKTAPGMGHDLPAPLMGMLADAIAEAASRARQS